MKEHRVGPKPIPRRVWARKSREKLGWVNDTVNLPTVPCILQAFAEAVGLGRVAVSSGCPSTQTGTHRSDSPCPTACTCIAAAQTLFHGWPILGQPTLSYGPACVNLLPMRGALHYADAGWCPAEPADDPAWDATLACNSRFEEQAGELRDACLGEEDTDPDPDPVACAPTEPLTHRAPELLANLLVLDDDAVVALDTDVSAPWFGATTGPPSVSANGLLLFGSAVDGCCEGGGLPRADGVDGIVALAWTDLDPSRGGTVSWQVDGDLGARQLRLSFLGVPAYTDGGEVSVEAVVYEADGAVDLHIGSLRSFDRTTLGAESQDGAAATCEAGWVGAILDLGAVSLRLPPQARR